jgi:hypothetical protein
MNKEEYLQGKGNFAIRVYFYMLSGVSIVNEFRNLFLGIFALYFTLKLENPLWLIGMFVVCVPILVVAGYYNVHKISKVKEWLSVKFGTHYSIKQFELMEKQVELLTKINDK